MELGLGKIYFYEFVNQNKFYMDLELLMEKNEFFEYTLISRIPPRRLIEDLDLSGLNVYWMTNSESNFTVKPEINQVLKIVQESPSEGGKIFFIEGLESLIEMGGEEDILKQIISFSDLIFELKSSVIISINPLSFSKNWFAKFKYISEQIDIIREENTLNSEAILEVEEGVKAPGDTLEIEIGEDGNPRLVILSKLPCVGFTRNILVKRILQWRRMGLDVSEIEPALSYTEKDSYKLYTEVEEKVRRAVDLDRFIHANSDTISASDKATDIFRLRQLTGLEELEKKYYSSSN